MSSDKKFGLAPNRLKANPGQQGAFGHTGCEHLSLATLVVCDELCLIKHLIS